MSGERDAFEVFKEACMDALCKLPDVTAARLKVAYRLLRHGNRKYFQKERRFLTWPSRATLIDETNLASGTVSDALLWLRGIGFWSDAERGQRPEHLRLREIAADFSKKVPAHRHFRAPKMPAHRHFKMPGQPSENASAAPAKCRPTGKDSLIPAEDPLRGKPAGGGVPHHTQPAAGLPAPTPKSPPPRAGICAPGPEPANCAALAGSCAQPAGSPPETLARKLLEGVGLARPPTDDELILVGVLGECFGADEIAAALNAVVNRRAADGWQPAGLAEIFDEAKFDSESARKPARRTA
jgi:hypothetical protein